MARTKTPSKGSKPDKLIRDQMVLDGMRTMRVPDQDNRGKFVHMSRLALAVRSIWNQAIKGNVQAFAIIADRIDGKVPAIVKGEGKDGAIPIDVRNLTNAQLEHFKERLAAGSGIVDPGSSDPSGD